MACLCSFNFERTFSLFWNVDLQWIESRWVVDCVSGLGSSSSSLSEAWLESPKASGLGNMTSEQQQPVRSLACLPLLQNTNTKTNTNTKSKYWYCGLCVVDCASSCLSEAWPASPPSIQQTSTPFPFSFRVLIFSRKKGCFFCTLLFERKESLSLLHAATNIKKSNYIDGPPQSKTYFKGFNHLPCDQEHFKTMISTFFPGHSNWFPFSNLLQTCLNLSQNINNVILWLPVVTERKGLWNYKNQHIAKCFKCS